MEEPNITDFIEDRAEFDAAWVSKGFRVNDEYTLHYQKVSSQGYDKVWTSSHAQEVIVESAFWGHFLVFENLAEFEKQCNEYLKVSDQIVNSYIIPNTEEFLQNRQQILNELAEQLRIDPARLDFSPESITYLDEYLLANRGYGAFIKTKGDYQRIERGLTRYLGEIVYGGDAARWKFVYKYSIASYRPSNGLAGREEDMPNWYKYLRNYLGGEEYYETLTKVLDYSLNP